MTNRRSVQFRPLRTPTARPLSRTTFARVLVTMVWANCIAIFAYHLTGNPLFQHAGNAAAILTVAGCIALAAVGGRFLLAKLVGLLLVADLAASWWFNPGRSDPIDTIKLFEIFAIYAAARECTGGLRLPRAIYGLAILPLLLLPFGSRMTGPEGWSFFPNANTAALFYTVLLFAFSVVNPRHKLAAQILVSVLSGKIGVLLASVGAMIVSGAVRLRGSGLLLAIFAAMLTGPLLSGALDRQVAVLGNLMADLYADGVSGIANTSYAQLYQMRGSDLSGYFRIIHWAEILAYWRDGGPAVWLFGYGGGYTPAFTTLKLVPHNDYLKVLAEFGLFAFAAFVALVTRAALSIRERVPRALFLVVAIYFASENLLTNFASMTLLFGIAGLIQAERDA